MSDDVNDHVEFDEMTLLAMARAAMGEAPRPEVKRDLMARIAATADGTWGPASAGPAAPEGFVFDMARGRDWQPHPVPGIRMKVLSQNPTSGYVTLLLDVAPNTQYPAHSHSGAEECYVISGTVIASGRRLGPGDFLHADAGTDHDPLYTDEGCQVLLVVAASDYL
jgi:quercetin dioxygenase-like cupin family protein